ncbi:MAG: putative exported protein [Pseudomonadota bacterium]
MSGLQVLNEESITWFSSAIIICRLMGLPDPRGQGSGNPGATNVMRIGGKKAAAITLLGDLLKGFIPVYSAGLLGLPYELLAITGLAAFMLLLWGIFIQYFLSLKVVRVLQHQLVFYWGFLGYSALHL